MYHKSIYAVRVSQTVKYFKCVGCISFDWCNCEIEEVTKCEADQASDYHCFDFLTGCLIGHQKFTHQHTPYRVCRRRNAVDRYPSSLIDLIHKNEIHEVSKIVLISERLIKAVDVGKSIEDFGQKQESDAGGNLGRGAKRDDGVVREAEDARRVRAQLLVAQRAAAACGDRRGGGDGGLPDEDVPRPRRGHAVRPCRGT